MLCERLRDKSRQQGRHSHCSSRAMEVHDHVHIDLSLFLAAQNSLDELYMSLAEASSFHPSPLILTQPPSLQRSRGSAIHNHLAQLDAKQHELDELGKKYEQLRAHLQRQRGICTSALAPVTALPHELLRRIFQLALAPFASIIWPKGSATNLAAVCTLWRRVALGDNALWSSTFSLEPRTPAAWKRTSCALTHYRSACEFRAKTRPIFVVIRRLSFHQICATVSYT